MMIEGLRTKGITIKIGIVLALISCPVYVSLLVERPLGTTLSQKEPRMPSITHEKAWEPIFFEEINERAKLAKLGNLRRATLPKDDLELRVWIGFGVIPLEGIIIRRRSGRWSALHLRSLTPHLARHNYEKALGVPKSGWDPLWQHLVREGILTLPDSSELKDDVLVMDGESFVIEVNKGGSYRTYKYSNPDLQKWPEAKRITEIVQTILNEFDIHRPLLKATS